MNEKQRDWFYLLPDGRTAINKKEACELLIQSDGRPLSSGYFRRMVKDCIIKKTNVSINANPEGDANQDNKAGTEPKI